MSKSLKIKANSEADMPVISSLLQDAILRVGEIRYSKSGRYVTLRLSRFRHEEEKPVRILAGLRIDDVTHFRSKNVDRSDPEALAVLLSLQFNPASSQPAGELRFILAGGGEISANVDSLALILTDVSEPRQTDKLPLHMLD